jgi:hypothetical protein
MWDCLGGTIGGGEGKERLMGEGEYDQNTLYLYENSIKLGTGGSCL